MPPRPFYEVSTINYLFGKTVEKPEEKVRQWVLFELISTYGIRLDDLQVERQIQLGQRDNIFADIVVLRSNRPYIIIECKRRGHKLNEKDVKQARSYAKTEDAEFIVLTNGESWRVERYVNQQWMIAPDIPHEPDLPGRTNVSTLLKQLEGITPILHWLYRAVPASEARKYLIGLVMLLAQYDMFDDADPDVLSALHSLVSAIAGCYKADDAYVATKLKAACYSFSEYLRTLGQQRFDREFDFYSIDELINIADIGLSRAVPAVGIEGHLDDHLLTLSIVALGYFRELRSVGEFIGVPEGMLSEIAVVIRIVCLIRLGVDLPSYKDNDALEIMYAICQTRWDELVV